MKFLHTMVRVNNIEDSMRFYAEGLGMREVRRIENERGRFTLIFLAADEDAPNMDKNRPTPTLELTYNWDGEEYEGGRNFGHLAYEVDNIYHTCQHLSDMGIVILRPPRDGNMAFVRSPDGISVEILQKGKALEPLEPWLSMENTGSW